MVRNILVDQSSFFLVWHTLKMLSEERYIAVAQDDRRVKATCPASWSVWHRDHMAIPKSRTVFV